MWKSRCFDRYDDGMIDTDSGVAHEWEAAPAAPAVAPDELHVWRVDLDVSEAAERAARLMLSRDEIARADRFIRAIHGRRFAVARASLRAILAAYIACPPDSLQFEYGEHGKPFLASEAPAFNVSHSTDRALIAVSGGMSVGVDIEWMRERVEAEKIARRFFAQAEVAMLESVPEDARQRVFYDCWTRKEAYVKACGGGLSIALSDFVVTCLPGESPEVVNVAEGGETVLPPCSLFSVAPGAGYAAAVAALGDVRALRLFDGDAVR